MGILKNIGEVFKQAFLSNDFVKSFWDEVSPPKNYQKEIAENLAKLAKEQEYARSDMRQGFEHLNRDR